MYLDHLHDSFDFVQDLLIFLILASFWLREIGQIWGFWQFSSEYIGGIDYIDMLVYDDSLDDCLHFSHGLLIFLILAIFWFSETTQICIFRAVSRESMGGIGWTNLVISDKFEMAKFQHTKIIQLPRGGGGGGGGGGIPDNSLV